MAKAHGKARLRPRSRRLVSLDDGELERVREALRLEVEKNRGLSRRNDELVRRIDGAPVKLGVGDPPANVYRVSATVALHLGVPIAEWLYTELHKSSDNRARIIREALSEITG